jgi:hypothetical protein
MKWQAFTLRFLLVCVLGSVLSVFAADRPRLAILTDIGGDPDDR